MTPHLSDFSLIVMCKCEKFITANSKTQSLGVGTVLVNSFTGSHWIKLELNNIQYIPSLPYLLFSEPVCKLKIITDPDKGTLDLLLNNQLLFTEKRDQNELNNNPYVMNLNFIRQNKSENAAFSMKTLHYRSGHCPPDILKQLVNRSLIK